MTIIIPEIGQPVPTNMLIPSLKCSFSVEQAINAPIEVVWSLVRQFNNPKVYKMFVRSSSSSSSSNVVGTIRHISYVTEFPSTMSIERLDELNDDKHVMVVSLVGGDLCHRLPNYQGTTSLAEANDDKVFGGQRRTIVTEKYVVNVPDDSNEEETRYLVDTLVRFNLRALARAAERILS